MNLNSSTVTIISSDTDASPWQNFKKRVRGIVPSRFQKRTFVLNQRNAERAEGLRRQSKASEKSSPKYKSDLSEKYGHIFRRKKRWELFILSSVVCGIEFVYSAMTAYVTPILLSLNLDVKFAMMIWCIGPTIGFFLTPILGSLSDKCNMKFGRRRPFIILLSFCILFGLIFIPHGKSVGKALGETQFVWNNTSTSMTEKNIYKTSSTDVDNEVQLQPWTIFFTIIGVIVLDFSADACQSPSRTYLLDVSVPEDHSIGLSTFTIIAGIGGFFGYLIGGINWDTTDFGSLIGGHINTVFTFITIFFLICCILTISSFTEMPLYILEDDKYAVELQKMIAAGDSEELKKQLPKNDKIDNETSNQNLKYSKPLSNNLSQDSNISIIEIKNDTNGILKNGSIKVDIENCNTKLKDENCMTNKDITNCSSTSQEVELKNINRDKENTKDVTEKKKKAQPPTLTNYFRSIIYMPKSLKILCLTKFFCAATLISYLLYFTDFVGESVFGGDPHQPEESVMYQLYHEGVKYGSFGMALYSISCSCYSYSMEFLIRKFGAKPVFIGGPIICSIGMVLMALCRHKIAVILLSPAPGFMYATIFILPYLLVSHYHATQQFGEDKNTNDASGSSNAMPVRGIGTDVAIVDSMVFVCQILLSLCMGSLVKLAQSSTVPIYAASFFSMCSAICATQVFYADL